MSLLGWWNLKSFLFKRQPISGRRFNPKLMYDAEALVTMKGLRCDRCQIPFHLRKRRRLIEPQSKFL
jgi:hypothetical protein